LIDLLVKPNLFNSLATEGRTSPSIHVAPCSFKHPITWVNTSFFTTAPGAVMDVGKQGIAALQPTPTYDNKAAQEKKLYDLNKQIEAQNTKQPYTDSQALINDFNQFYDPKTGLSTNPYFQKGVDVLNANPMPEQYQQAADLYGGSAKKLTDMSNYTADKIKEQQVTGSSMEGPDKWTTQQAQSYMNPYMQTALQSQADLSNRQFNNTMQGLRSQQAQQGAYGGSRGAVLEQQAQNY